MNQDCTTALHPGQQSKTVSKKKKEEEEEEERRNKRNKILGERPKQNPTTTKYDGRKCCISLLVLP